MLHLQIVGRCYAGYEALYEYAPKADASEVLANPERFAPDFASVTDFRLVEETNQYESTGRGLSRRIDMFKTLRGFRKGWTPRRFHRRINGYA